ncbi:hypothetical protein P170DRAFT_477090 [Aspergillus steynii IBT 23096]|uniref:AAA+ ATPase domain-containing protein n=1 Tax=Aspergillus steynii IBT 23096 TaxID=1392250 RepID=A0A2I2G6H1_9EURO|nr:uncharacterized protein P170DRAFT_477090 [Aspergillus steynii IBT 23096]PLB48475.1 hypothetical protein P170DRAFT_477090 [Aspergillus steynii IBT 23096]
MPRHTYPPTYPVIKSNDPQTPTSSPPIGQSTNSASKLPIVKRSPSPIYPVIKSNDPQTSRPSSPIAQGNNASESAPTVKRSPAIGQSYNTASKVPIAKRPLPSNEKKELKVTTTRKNLVQWHDFMRNHQKKVPGKVHAIDVLIGDAVIPHEIWSKPQSERPFHFRYRGQSMLLQDVWRVRDDEVASKDAPVPAGTSHLPEGDYPHMPDRIRINGDSLQKLLEKLLNIEIHQKGSPIVLLKPFKLLVQHEKAIRDLHTQLRKKFGPIAITEQFPNCPSNQTPDDPQPSSQSGYFSIEEKEKLLNEYGTEQAYRELSCLVDFMDNELKPIKALESGLVEKTYYSVQAFKELPCLEDFIDDEPKPIKAPESTSVEKVYYSDLWHLFKTGQVVITREPLQAYRVLCATGGRSYLFPPKSDDDDLDDLSKRYIVPAKGSDFLVLCYQIQYDGHRFGPVTRTFTIQPFSGARSIEDLPIYPLQFAQDSKVKKTLQCNGEKFLHVSRGGHFQYNGPNLHDGGEIDSQVIVDFETALWDDRDKDPSWNYMVQFGISPPMGANEAEVVMVSPGGCREKDCCENDRVFNDFGIDRQNMEDFMAKHSLLNTDACNFDGNSGNASEEDLIIFPCSVFAFVLKTRQWAVVDLNHVVLDIADDIKERGWNSLALPAGHKRIVYSLVRGHIRHSGEEPNGNSQSDLIGGREKGLTIRLYGATGVGKTSTAEYVAEVCDLPLYSVACGDLDTTAIDLEPLLESIFAQAQKWKCVLLLDEADILLTQRDDNAKDNSPASVLFRVLENYKGILFLTTNQLGKIDKALQSRILVNLFYPPLNKRATHKLFRKNLRLAKTNGIEADFWEIRVFAIEHYKNTAPERRWNGRQIRRAFQIAIAIAEQRAAEKNKKAVKKGRRQGHKPCMKWCDFELIEQSLSRFDDFAQKVRDVVQPDLATQNDDRDDDPGLNQDRGYESSIYSYSVTDDEVWETCKEY